MIFLSLFLLYSLNLITATHNTTEGPYKEESKMNTMIIASIAGGSLLLIVVVILLVVFLVILPRRRKKKAYKRREAQVLEVLPKLKLTRTIEEPEVHSVERITQWSDREKEKEKTSVKNEDKNSKQLGLPPMVKTSKESTEPSKEKTTPTPSKKEGKSTKSSKESNKDPNKEKSIEKDKSVDTLDFVDSPK